MGMFTEGYNIDNSLSIDENYSGLMGCLQIVSDSIHNEQVMFETLFKSDYSEALNEEMSDSNPIKKLGDFILKIIKMFREKINSVVDSIIEKMDNSKSKKLKELSLKIPKGLTPENEKIKTLIKKYSVSEEKTKETIKKINDGEERINVVHDGKRLTRSAAADTTKLFELIKIKGAAINNVKFEPTALYNTLNKYIDMEVPADKDTDFDSIIGDLEKEITISLGECLDNTLYNISKDPAIFIKNLYNPSYIIDNATRDLRSMKKEINNILNSAEKNVKKRASNAKKDKNAILVKNLNIVKESVNIMQTSLPKVISVYTNLTSSTYKAYVYSLTYLAKANSSDSEKDTKENEEIEESLNYDIDMEFGIL